MRWQGCRTAAETSGRSWRRLPGGLRCEWPPPLTTQMRHSQMLAGDQVGAQANAADSQEARGGSERGGAASRGRAGAHACGDTRTHWGKRDDTAGRQEGTGKITAGGQGGGQEATDRAHRGQQAQTCDGEEGRGGRNTQRGNTLHARARTASMHNAGGQQSTSSAAQQGGTQHSQGGRGEHDGGRRDTGQAVEAVSERHGKRGKTTKCTHTTRASATHRPPGTCRAPQYTHGRMVVHHSRET